MRHVPLLLLLIPLSAFAENISVLDHDADPTGETDSTAAFQASLDAAGNAGSGVVHVPAGKYLFHGTLTIPERVTLEGDWRAPVRGIPFDGGSVLLPTAGKGNENGTPFIRMGSSTVLKGINIFYPEQVRENPPTPYPWTVQSDGFTDNITIIDVTMVNPYKAVDLGTYPAGRHLVRNLHAYPLYRGLYVNQCYDVGRLENIHFWPYWDTDPDSPLWEFTREHAVAFTIGKTDGEMGHNLFSIFYAVGMHFIAGPIYDADRNIVDRQPGSGMYTNCYMDVTERAIQVDAAMPTAGVSFVNASIMSRVVTGPNNMGPVKFSASGFWSVGGLDSHAKLEGRGTVFFDACQFNNWDQQAQGAPCIDANVRRLSVQGCDFPVDRPRQNLVRLGPRTRAAVISSNLMPGGEHIVNDAPEIADIQIANNAVEPRPNYLSKWIVAGAFPNDTDEQGVRTGLDTDFLGGETKAILRTGTIEWEGKEYAVQPQRTDYRRRLDFHDAYPQTNRVAYAQTWVYSESRQRAQFELGFNDGAKVWVNDAEVYRYYHPNGQQLLPGFAFFEADLDSGWNRILVKVEDAGGKTWALLLEGYHEDGSPLKSSRAPEPE